jgi:hypothetical protein
MIKTNELGQNYVRALRKKYEAEMEEAVANLSLYLTNLSAIGEHSDLLEEHDKWITRYTDSAGKLETLNSIVESKI